jgi:hypothetical protein
MVPRIFTQDRPTPGSTGGGRSLEEAAHGGEVAVDAVEVFADAVELFPDAVDIGAKDLEFFPRSP